ncbi:hypothetical protein HQ545_05440 [Candidatus Woesearchaeota archaeon]|nr:hypothetical protein [Candidatus Woesearchaeota archaeon]
MLRYLTKAQVAFEFVILIAIMFATMIIFTAFVRDNFTDIQSDSNYFRIKDVALAVQSELYLAVTLEDGYLREFSVPLTLDGLEYNITKQGNNLIFLGGDADYSVTIPVFQGDVEKGNNVISKVGGVVRVNV